METVVWIYLFSYLFNLAVPVISGIKYQAVYENIFTDYQMIAGINRQLLYEIHRKYDPSLGINLAIIFTDKGGHDFLDFNQDAKIKKKSPLSPTFLHFFILTC